MKWYYVSSIGVLQKREILGEANGIPEAKKENW